MTLVADAPVVRRTSVLVAAVAPAGATTAALLAVGCLVSGLSYPGFPMDAAACAVVAASSALAIVVGLGARALTSGRGRPRAALVLTLVTVVLLTGALVARADDGRRLRARWAASQAAFEQEVLRAGAPVRAEIAEGSGSFGRYPGECPVRIGEISIGECRSVDGGFLFLQSQAAVTDDSGIVYLPGARGSASTWRDAETLTPLGGPWWSWTCGC